MKVRVSVGQCYNKHERRDRIHTVVPETLNNHEDSKEILFDAAR